MMTTSHRELQLLYLQIVETVTMAVNDWDPLSLIAAGAPDTEFADEVAKVVAKLPKTKTAKALAEGGGRDVGKLCKLSRQFFQALKQLASSPSALSPILPSR